MRRARGHRPRANRLSSEPILHLIADRDAPAKARTVINAALADDDRADIAMLATSELVTNALRYGAPDDGATIELLVMAAGGTVRVEVLNADAATGTPDLTAGAGAPDASGGWGLEIVEQLTRRWGVEHDHGRTRVWFEV